MKPKVDTTIQFSGLKPGRYSYRYELDRSFFEVFENEELCEGKVDFEVNLERHERMLMFNFAFEGRMKTICDRCLREMEVPVKGEQTLCVKFSDTETSEDEDVVILPDGAYEIDLAQWMYEYVAVSMPMQCVHPEGECDPEMLRYITEESEEDGEPKEMAAGETDPRWDALKQLLDNNK